MECKILEKAKNTKMAKNPKEQSLVHKLFVLSFVNIVNIAKFDSSQCYICSSHREIHTVCWDTSVQPPRGVSRKHLLRWLVAHLVV